MEPRTCPTCGFPVERRVWDVDRELLIPCKCRCSTLEARRSECFPVPEMASQTFDADDGKFGRDVVEKCRT